MSVQVWNKNPDYDPSDPSSSPGEAKPISGRVNSSINNLIDVSIDSPSNGQALIYNDQTGIWENGDAADLDVLETCKNVTNADTSEWTSESYSKGDYVIKDNHLYCANTTTSATWTGSEWDEVDMILLKNALANTNEKLSNQYILLGTSNSTSQDHTINLSAGDKLSNYQALVITLAYNNSSIVSSTMFFDSTKNTSTSYYDKNTSVSDMAQYIAVSDTQFKMYTNAATWYGNLYGIRK